MEVNMNKNKYNPYSCEICKMLYTNTNPIYDSGYIYCKKYMKEEHHCQGKFYGTNKLNHIIYKYLNTRCKCNKNYPSKLKLIKFKILAWLRHREDIKYHRYEDE